MENVTNVQINIMKDLMNEPHASEVRATRHFTNVCAKYGADPLAVLDVLSLQHQRANVEFKKREEARFEELKKNVESK